MEGLIVIAAVIAFSYWAFRVGKREGSQKGFAAGRRRERRQRYRREPPTTIAGCRRGRPPRHR
jgi:hypothetical protein